MANTPNPTTALAGEASKLLLTGKKIRKTTKTEFIISLIANDFSQASDAFAGKLRLAFVSCNIISFIFCSSSLKREGTTSIRLW